jgi:hypothetical protein
LHFVQLDLVQRGVGGLAAAVQRDGRYFNIPLATGGDDGFPRRGCCGERRSPFDERATVSQETYSDETFERSPGIANCPRCAGDRGYGLCDHVVMM